MHRHILAAVLSLLLAAAAPFTAAAAHPEYDHAGDPNRSEQHHHQHPKIDWSSTPADIQALKGKLDQLRTEQKQLFEQMKQQRQEIRNAHENITGKKHDALKGEAKDLMKKLHASRDAVRSLKDRSHAVWHQFHAHSQAKQWDAAKRDMTSIIALKQEIIANQKVVVRTQQRIVELMQK